MKKTSRVWNYFITVDGGKHMCNYCKAVLSVSNGSTGNLKRHLKVRHPNLNEIKDNACEEVLNEREVEKNVITENEMPSTSVLPSYGVETTDRRKRKRYDKLMQIKQKGLLDNSFSVRHNESNNIKYNDDYAIYGKNVASRMRNAFKTNRAVASAKNQIDNILFKLEMGEFDDACSAENIGPNYPIVAEFIPGEEGPGHKE